MMEKNTNIEWIEKSVLNWDTTISNEIISNLNNSIEIDSKTWSLFIDVNWNKISIKEVNENCSDELYVEKIRSIWNEIFTTNTEIDSIIFIKKINWEDFLFFVYERNWNFSEMCWNWAIWTMYYIKNKYWINEANLITSKWKKIQWECEWETININLWSIETNWIENILNIDRNLNLANESILKFLENPEMLLKLLKSKDKAIYYIQLFSNLCKDDNFLKFIKSLQIKDLKYISWEPHMIIKLEDNGLTDFLIDYYLKAVSFLLRYNDKWEYNIKWDINFMFYYENKNWEIKILPSERWVDWWVKCDQTWACWTGSVALWSYIINNQDIDNIEIVNRSWRKIKVSKNQKNEFLIHSTFESIQKLKSNYMDSFFSANAIIENFRYNLENNWYNSEGKSYLEILELIENRPQSSLGISNIFWNIIFSSCLHETEYPIDPYKISSSVNASFFARTFWIDIIESPYLDTLNSTLKTYPNIKTNNWKLFKNITALVDKLSQIIKWNKKSIKDLLKYLENRENIAIWELLEKINPEIVNIIEEIESLFEWVIWINLKNINDSDYWKYIIEYFKKIWIYEEVLKNLPEWIKENKINSLLIQTTQRFINSKINSIFELFVKSLLKYDFKEIENKEIEKVINKCLQDSVITVFLRNNASNEIIDLLKEKWVLDKNEKFNKSISSQDKSLRERISSSFVAVLSDEELWEKFFIKYFENIYNLKKKPVLLWEFNDVDNWFKWLKVYFLIDEWKNKIFAWKWNEKFEISSDYFFNLLTKEENIINPQWAVFLSILSIWCIPMFWSERWYREITLKTLSEILPDKYREYIEFIKITQIVSDYDPNITNDWDNRENYVKSFPSWTDNSYYWDILMETIISENTFSRKKLLEFLQNNMSDNNLDYNDKILLLEEISLELDIYDFDVIINNDIKKIIESWKTDRIEKLEEIRKIIKYKWKNIKKIIESLYNKYLLLQKI